MDTFSATVFSRVSVENQVLKSGYTSRDLIILENDDPGGVFEFSPASRGPYIIKVSMKETLISSVLNLRRAISKDLNFCELFSLSFIWYFTGKNIVIIIIIGIII